MSPAAGIPFTPMTGAQLLIHTDKTLYGRYWGAIENVDCLHFETAYYQPLEFCIANKIACFEGGAQGEHKMARGFLPQKTWSAHWLKHPGFADAVQRFLEQENDGIEGYIDELNDRSPFRANGANGANGASGTSGASGADGANNPDNSGA